MSASVHAIYPPEPDLDAAIDFIKTLNPDGHQCLVAIRDGNIINRFFKPGLWEEKRKLMSEWAAEKRNVYVLVNEPRAGATQREKEDIAFIRAVVSDTDHKLVKAKALDAMDDLMKSSRPAYVNDSGGGIHTFFILAQKVPVTPATQQAAETAGRGLRAFFDGDAVQDITRIMRVPGTVNWLDPKKRAKGRQIAPTSVLAKSGDRVTLDDMLKDYPAPAGAAGQTISGEAEKKAMAEIDMVIAEAAGGSYGALDAGLRQRFEETRAFTGLWANGVQNGDGSGSGHVFQLALILQEEGFTGTEFAAIASCWDFVKPSNVEHRALARAWASAARNAQAGRAFNDIDPKEVDEVVTEGKPARKLGPFVFIKPHPKLERRDWLYGRRLIRRFMSSTVAAGGTGKSSLTMVEAVAMATGRDLLNVGTKKMPRFPLRVMLWNGEDPQQELDLRFHAIVEHYGVTQAELGNDRLMIMSGRDVPLVMAGATGRGTVGIDKECVTWMKDTITSNAFDVVVIDPFVSSHRVPENDNMAIDLVAKTWARIAEDCGCAVELVHHIRKPSGNGGLIDLTVDDARGASALVSASRNARVLSPMSDEVAKTYGVNRRAYFCIQHDATKANMAPGATGVDWYHFVSVDIDNGDPFPVDGGPGIDGDSVGVVEPWEPTSAINIDPAKVVEAQVRIAAGEFRADMQSPDWIGGLIGEVLGLDLDKDRKLIKSTITKWLAEGWIVKARVRDAKSNWRNGILVGKQPDISAFDDP